MGTINNILKTKGDTIWSVTPKSNMYDALQMMADHDVGALLVMQDEHLAGIVSERDYARKVILLGRSSRETLVEEVMTTDVVTITVQQSITDCMALMTERRIRHLPAVNGDRVVGMVSIGDLVKAIIDEQQFQIEELSRYIAQ